MIKSYLQRGFLLTRILLFANQACAQFTRQEITLNSGRPTFHEPSTSISGKIALEEHVGNDLFTGVFTTPPDPDTNEVTWDTEIYKADVLPRLTNIDSRIANMNAANISISVLMFGSPGIQGIFNKSLATDTAQYVNDYLSRVYKHGNYSGRFEFWCSNALQEPVKAAMELERCVRQLGGVGSFVGGYTNNGSVNNIVYLDDPSNAPFLEKVVELDIPIYLHPRMPAPNQQRVYQGYNFLGGSPLGFSAETAGHALRLMVSGIFDQYPTLQIVLGHCGEGLPFFLPRIDQRLRHFEKSWQAQKSMKEYWDSNFWVTTSGVMDFGALMDTIRRTGEDRVLFAVDYPFEDTVEVSGWFDRVEMSERARRKIGKDNAKELLKLDAGGT